MMIAFKILMFLTTILSIIGCVGEKDPKARNTFTAMFGISGGLLLLAIVASQTM